MSDYSDPMDPDIMEAEEQLDQDLRKDEQFPTDAPEKYEAFVKGLRDFMNKYSWNCEGVKPRRVLDLAKENGYTDNYLKYEPSKIMDYMTEEFEEVSVDEEMNDDRLIIEELEVEELEVEYRLD